MKKELRGRAHVFGDSISTDLICPGRYFHLRSNIKELAKHTLEDADKDFVKKINPGDFVVAGDNFGCGSSREHAPIIIKECGVGAVIAKSFARIFFRNAINIGLLAMECNTEDINEGDELILKPSEGIIESITSGKEIKVKPLTGAMYDILNAGGLKNYIKM